MAENNEPANPEPTVPRVPPAVSRRHLPAERQGPAAAPRTEEAMAALADSMKVLAKHFGGEEEEDNEKERPGRRVKKFTRSGANEDRPGTATASRPATADEGSPENGESPITTAQGEKAAAFNKNVAWPRAGQGDRPESDPAPAGRPGRKKRNKWLVLAVVQGTGFALLLGGFWLGQLTASSDANGGAAADQSPVRPPLPGVNYRISERALQAASAALHTARTGDSEAAVKQLNELLTTNPEVPGVHYQIARLALQSGDAIGGYLHLDRSTEVGEFMAACNYAQARRTGLKGNYHEVAHQFEAAARAEPFNGHNFFYWGEALRREGKPLSAIGVFDQAIDRAHTKADGLLYLFKQQLARVEAGSDETFNAELADHLKQSPVVGEWLLIGAAQDILHANLPAAAELLKKAAATLGHGEYDILIKDYLFQTAADEPTLAGLVQRPAVPESTEGGGFYLDPTVMPPSFGDPAIWPVNPTN